MTERERFLATMRGEAIRPPLWEEGIQDDTWETWRAQGLARPEDLLACFPFDRREVIEANLGALPIMAGGDGEDPLDRLRAGYRAAPERLPADWKGHAESWGRRDHPLGITVGHGLFLTLGVQDWSTLSRLLYALYEQPSAVEAVMAQAAAMAVSLLEQLFQIVTPDFALFSEPIASFHAPVISPPHYQRFWLPYVRRVAEALDRGGVTVRIVQTYGNVESLIPLWLDAGMTALWNFHIHRTGSDYTALRRRYGQDLRLIGGIDSLALLQGGAGTEAAVRSVLPLLEQGGYLPMLDDRVRPFVPYANYVLYRERLARTMRGAQGLAASHVRSQ